MKTNKNKIKEAIIVEGRDDVAVVSQVFDTLIIPTHGFGITGSTWKLIDKAYKEKGLIILTDPDFSGREIRKKISEKYPNAKQAYISKEEGLKNGNIGVENATIESVERAILKVHTTKNAAIDEINLKDMERLGLSGCKGAADRRENVASILGIGYGNSKTFVKNMNAFGIKLSELEKAVEQIVKKQKKL